MSGRLPSAVLIKGMPNANVFCDEHSKAAVRLGGSRPGSSLFDRTQKTALKSRYMIGMAAMSVSNELPSTPMPRTKVSENTL